MDTKKKLFHSRPIFYGFLSLMLALSTSKFLFDGNVKYIIFDLILLLGFAVYCCFGKQFKFLIIMLCIFAFGMGWWFVGVQTFQPKEFVGECQVVGRVSDDVQEYYNNVTAVLRDVYINGQKEGDISLYIRGGAGEIMEGDVISFTAKIEKAKLYELGSFNSFYYRDRTPYTADISSFEIIGNRLTAVEKFRLKMKAVLYEHMGEEQGAVAFAVLFGDKTEINDDIYDTYKTAGIVHILTVSGLHVSFLIGLLAFILKKCKIRGVLNFIICAAIVFLYAYVCNFSPSILRAGIMGLVLTFTALSGKCYDRLNSLGLAGIIILIFMPLSGMDLGFLMSFFCLLAIFTISPLLSRFLRKHLPKFVADGFSLTIAVQIGILPFLGQMFMTFNFLTIFANLITIPIFTVLYPLLLIGALLTAMLNFFGFLLVVGKFGLELIYGTAQFFGQTNLILNLQPLNIFFVGSLFVFFFLASRYFLASKNAKVMTCGVVFTLTEILFGLSFIQIPVGATISYCVNYSTSTIVLTNSSGESLAVDLGKETFMRKTLNAIGIKNISALVVLQDASIDGHLAQELGAKVFFRCENQEGWDEEYMLDFDDVASYGWFELTFLSFDKKLVGVEISFDNTDVFILKNRNTSDEAISYLAEKNFDFVILGERSEYANAFSPSAKVITRSQTEFSHSSIEKNGNISYRLDGNNFYRRCLD